ncbi:hypothetical protein U879_12395 [Defluviimonas sp. 20V17]|uniref:Uncharacterized protein n=1 Tax=Allgaiera indica TaxID=765699 RepID=A0AAN4UNA6_9RHOB|nr:hypothetical protein [Allgaiera indica]KDB03375.1 hypothetical protein U879_12395 [Defluviimonas sp. 20V17]GHD98595.1 hypothetical protein GCM10008024_02740 [Allgaiera indica]SDW10218.1 hypothetical protein SAMN05444006_101274 [Allgaiera indica]
MSDMIPPRSSPIPAEIYGTSRGLFYLLGVRPDAEAAPAAPQVPPPGVDPAPSSATAPPATALLAQVQMADMFCFRL